MKNNRIKIIIFVLSFLPFPLVGKSERPKIGLECIKMKEEQALQRHGSLV
jgi:hypothetical protein